jgi:hypothetical protein
MNVENVKKVRGNKEEIKKLKIIRNLFVFK